MCVCDSKREVRNDELDLAKTMHTSPYIKAGKRFASLSSLTIDLAAYYLTFSVNQANS